jgi:hypothetical protein
MKLNERCSNFKIAMSIVGMPIDDLTSELILALFDHINQKKGDTTIRDLKKIENVIVSKYAVMQQAADYINNTNNEPENPDTENKGEQK